MFSATVPEFFGGESKNTEQAAQWAAAEESGRSSLENSMESTGPPRALPYLGSTGAGAAVRTTELALSGDPGTLCWKSVASDSGAHETGHPGGVFRLIMNPLSHRLSGATLSLACAASWLNSVAMELKSLPTWHPCMTLRRTLGQICLQMMWRTRWTPGPSQRQGPTMLRAPLQTGFFSLSMEVAKVARTLTRYTRLTLLPALRFGTVSSHSLCPQSATACCHELVLGMLHARSATAPWWPCSEGNPGEKTWQRRFCWALLAW